MTIDARKNLVGSLIEAGHAPKQVRFIGNEILGDQVIQSFADADATPSVSIPNTAFKTANTGSTTITDLIDGRSGQVVTVIFDDANTTVDFTGSGLIGNGGADWSPSLNDQMICVYDGTDWYCAVIDTSGGAEVNDLTAAVTWDNIPDANVPESAVTQHEGALSITQSQISDVTALAAEVNLLDLSGLTAGWVLSADTATTASWKAAAGGGGPAAGTTTGNMLYWDGADWVETTTAFVDVAGVDKGLYVEGTSTTVGGVIYGRTTNGTLDWELGNHDANDIRFQALNSGDDLSFEVVGNTDDIYFTVNGDRVGEFRQDLEGGLAILNAVTGAPTIPERVLNMADIDAGNFKLVYSYNNSSGMTNPGSQFFRTDAAPASVTQIVISDTTYTRDDWGSKIDLIQVGDFIYASDAADEPEWALWEITGITDETGWRTIDVAVIDNGSDFTNNREVTFNIWPFSRCRASQSPINTQNGNYTLVMTDAGKTIHKATSTASITHTIPANSSVAYPIGSLIGFKNSGTVNASVAITTDTMTGTDGTTGTQTLGPDHTAVAHKLTATTWSYAASDM